MSVFALYNIKGGVGKTAAAVNLAWLSASEGIPTLLWDLDPQGAASFYFRIKPKVKGGARRLLSKKSRAPAAVKATDHHNLDLLPADFSYRNLDLALEEENKPLRAIRRVLKPMKSDYQHIFLDCAPSISLVSENVFVAADVLLVPMIPTTLSMRTLDQLTNFLARNNHERLEVLPFFTMVDRRKTLHIETIKWFVENRTDMLQSYVPYSADVERMGTHRTVLADFAPRSPGMMALRGIWSEVKTVLAKPG